MQVCPTIDTGDVTHRHIHMIRSRLHTDAPARARCLAAGHLLACFNWGPAFLSTSATLSFRWSFIYLFLLLFSSTFRHTLSSNSNNHSTQLNQPHPPNHQHVCPQRQRSQRGHHRSGHQLPLRTCFLTSTLHPLSLANNPIRTLPTTLPRPSRVPPPPPPRRPTRRRPRATSPATTPSPTVPLAPLTPLATRSTRRSTRAPPRPTSRASKCTLLDEQWYGYT